MTTEEKIIKILEDVSTAYDEIDRNTTIEFLELNDLDELECELDFEAQFELPDKSCDNIFKDTENVGQLIDKIENLIKNK